ncbi:MAG: ABC transporter ATP-binding protein/permease [Bacilli bacterium]|jgi:ATP-binding cassette subfamily B protein|nr:ABC transporter ATP-binding protein/permease [Bacilli bacterium]MCH4235409.1 ABC transporter ATP-binding protein/permease [Bacilli bacterium]
MANPFSMEEEPVANKINARIWLRIIRYSFKYWYILVTLLITLLFTSLYDSSFTPIMNRAALTAIADLNLNPVSLADFRLTAIFYGITISLTFVEYTLLLVAALLVRAVVIYFTFFLTNYLDMKIMLALRRDSFHRIQELSFSYFDRTSSGWLIARMQNDTSRISDILSWGIIRMIWMAFDIVITLVTMFSMDWRLSLIILASTPAIIIISPIFEKTILRLARVARAAYSGFVGWLAECINGSKTIKTLAIEGTTYDEAEEIVEDIRAKNFKRMRFQSFFQPSVNMIAAFTTAAMILFGYKLLPTNAQGVADVGLLTIFLGFVGSIYNPIQEGAELFAEVMATQASAEKVLSLIDEQPVIVDREDVLAKYGSIFAPKKENYEPMLGNIEFKNVSFSYITGHEVIHQMNLNIKQGQSIAIVGETGSGKSTTVNLLCRFYEPTDGGIYIDGVEYRDRSVGWLRSNIGFVQQNPFIFGGTIADNIRYGKLDATMEEIINAAKVVDLDSYVQSLPDGYYTVLQDGGAELSVGQKQLISFARAIIRDPKLMILDEATSSIDTETEAIIQKAIKRVLVGRTAIIIAHRLSTIVDSDRILLMDQGIIKEDGSHAELMRQHAGYYKLYMNQFQDLQVDAQIDTFEKQLKDI